MTPRPRRTGPLASAATVMLNQFRPAMPNADDLEPLTTQTAEPVPTGLLAPAPILDLARIARGVPVVIYVHDLRAGRNAWINGAVEALLGYTAEEVAEMGPDVMAKMVHPDDVDTYARHRALLGDGPGRLTFRARHRDGGWRHLESEEVVHARDSAGMPIQVLGAAHDVSARQGREDALRLLTRELSHRLRNVFTVLGALVRITARRSSPESQDALSSLQNQIRALSRANDAPSRDDERAVGLRALILRTLEPYREGCAVDVAEGDLDLPPDVVISVGLILHELATNAVKHGALGDPEGRLAVEVRPPEAPGGTVVVDWRETVSARPEPTEAGGGFGRVLVEGAVAQLGGSIEAAYEPGGARIALRLPDPRPDPRP